MSAPISVTLPDGSRKELPAGSTAMDLAKAISLGLAKAVVLARVKTQDRTEVVDLSRALPDGAQVWLLKMDDKDAQDTLRHSTEHILATAVCRLFRGAQVTMGPRDHGKEFYYDFDIGRPFTPEDVQKIEAEMQKIVAEDVPFTREEMSKADARKLFKELGQRFKDEILDWIPDDTVTIYRNADFIDLCRGPHLPRSGLVKAFKLNEPAACYWRADATRDSLQRISGIAFANKDELQKHVERVEEAKKRDHRRLGKELGLFIFHPIAPASPFFLPKGTLVYNGLVEFIRKLYVKYGYQEVVTPQVFDTALFKTSGHYDMYRDGMYFAYGAAPVDVLRDAFGKAHAHDHAHDHAHAEDEDAETREFGVKPMNCPGHCILFANSGLKSHRDLPLRIADFGRLHRFEKGGVTHGLARVRTFSQDDAHIFCTEADVQKEIGGFFKLLDDVYNAFEFKDVQIRLATRPEKRAGTDAQWDAAEAALEKALKDAGRAFTLAPGDGAFYGPKLEFHVKDALDRSWQLGTIQVDYILPQRFELTYVGSDGQKHTPVMLHRAILGSLERFFGVYLEHIAGKFPAWLAPQQVRVLTVTERALDYATHLQKRLAALGMRVDVDNRPEKLGFKVREAQVEQVPYALVLGDKELDQKGATVRERGGKDLGFMTEDAIVEMLARVCAMPA